MAILYHHIYVRSKILVPFPVTMFRAIVYLATNAVKCWTETFLPCQQMRLLCGSAFVLQRHFHTRRRISTQEDATTDGGEHAGER